nr:hypothetical protein [Streptomyces oceani]
MVNFGAPYRSTKCSLTIMVLSAASRSLQLLPKTFNEDEATA